MRNHRQWLTVPATVVIAAVVIDRENEKLSGVSAANKSSS
jgi:hypothetical protein